MILQNKECMIRQKLYRNLSLDSLLKFSNKEQKYKRYLDMAEMYHKLGETRDSSRNTLTSTN